MGDLTPALYLYPIDIKRPFHTPCLPYLTSLLFLSVSNTTISLIGEKSPCISPNK